MRTLILIALIVVVGCKKEEPGNNITATTCKDCTTKVTRYNPDGSVLDVNSHYEGEKCGDELKEWDGKVETITVLGPKQIRETTCK